MSVSRDDDELYWKEMKKYSSFYFDEDLRLNHKRLKERLDKLLEDIDFGFDTIEENVCVHNFVSYLYWNSDEKQEAVRFAEKALELGSTCTYTSLGGTENLVTIGNLRHFHKMNGDIVEARRLDEQFETLSKREDFQELKYIAKAEQAICLSKLGPSYSRKAIQIFYETVDKMQDTMNCWQFYFALTLRRKSHTVVFDSEDKYDTAFRRDIEMAFNKFLKIISDNYLEKLKSRSWCEIGIILQRIPDLARTDSCCEKFGDLNPEKCFTNALEICPQSYHALQQYGKYLRYMFNFQKSKEMLEKSLYIRETSTGRHQLGVTLQKMVLQEHTTKKRAKRSQQRNRVSFRTNTSDLPSTQVNLSSTKNTTDDTECTAAINRIKRLKNKLKSPRCVPQYPEHPMLLKAEQHLQRAIELDVTFDIARYALGQVQRMLGKSDTALRNFRDITHAKKGSNDQFLSLAAFEQQAFCRFDLMKKNGDEKELENAKEALWNALSIISIYINVYPELKKVCSTIKELQNIVLKDTLHPEEEAKFHEMLQNREKAVDLYSKCTKSKEIYMKMVQNYLADGNFKKAICLLDQLIVNKDPCCPSGEFLFQTYIDGAKYSLRNRKFDDVKIRIMQSLRYIPAWEKYFENESDTDVDFHIIHECEENCPRAEKLLGILKRNTFINWNVTLNAEDCQPGRDVLEYYDDTSKMAKFILLFLHDKLSNCDDEFLKLAQKDIIICMKEKTLLMTLGDEDQPSYRYLPTITLPPTMDSVEDGDGDSEMVLEARIICDILTATYQLQTKGTCSKKTSTSRHEP